MTSCLNNKNFFFILNLKIYLNILYKAGKPYEDNWLHGVWGTVRKTEKNGSFERISVHTKKYRKT